MKIVATIDNPTNFWQTAPSYADMIGWEYVLGGRDASGIDCWGVVSEVYRRAGLELPDPWTDPQGVPGIMGLFDPAVEPFRVYDIFFVNRNLGHCGVLVTLSQFLTTARSSRVSLLEKIKLNRFGSRVQCYRVKDSSLV